MIGQSAIQALCDHIIAEFRPEKVVLFGSHAAGSSRDDSDVDLLVIMPFDGSPAWKAIEIMNRVDPRFPVDLLVRTPKQIEERLVLGDYFIREIIEQGVVLYEAAHAGVGRQG